MGPSDHAQEVGSLTGEIVELADEFGEVVGLESDCLEELGAVSGRHFAEQRGLVAEVGVQAFLAGVGGVRDAVDTRTGQAVADPDTTGGPAPSEVYRFSGRGRSRLKADRGGPCTVVGDTLGIVER